MEIKIIKEFETSGERERLIKIVLLTMLVFLLTVALLLVLSIYSLGSKDVNKLNKTMEINEIKKLNKSVLADANEEVLEELANEVSRTLTLGQNLSESLGPLIIYVNGTIQTETKEMCERWVNMGWRGSYKTLVPCE